MPGNDVQADVAFVGGVGGAADARLRDVLEPVRRVVGDRVSVVVAIGDARGAAGPAAC